jgi:DNA end-binding protein Ku
MVGVDRARGGDMPKAVWTGNLSLGLVNVPVSLYAATQPKDVRFHLYDREGRRVRYRRVVEMGPEDPWEPTSPAPSAASARAPSNDDVDEPSVPPTPRAPEPAEPEPFGEREVDYADLVRGVEIDRDRFVMLEQEEIERARPQPSHTIDLEHFVSLDEIDPIFFEKSYFLAPRRDAEKPYLLLLKAMRNAGRVGIGRFVLRTKPHLVAIRPMEGVLGLETLYFGDEVREPREIVSTLAGIKVSAREIQMAESLIDMLAVSWDPNAYADEYREELLRVISEKTAQEVEAPTTASSNESRIQDLMEALKQSVEAAKKAKAPAKKRRRAG